MSEVCESVILYDGLMELAVLEVVWVSGVDCEITVGTSCLGVPDTVDSDSDCRSMLEGRGLS